MTVKIQHLLRPVRSANIAKERITAQLNMRRFAKRGERHFRDDRRFDLTSVKDGFAERFADRDTDGPLLERICAAYRKARMGEESATGIYRATEWWQGLRRTSLSPAINALRNGDCATLRGMYRNFFRDPCSAGLTGMPYGMSRMHLHGAIRDIHRRVYLTDTLYRIDYWKARTEGRFAVRDLAGPGIGNPFGIFLDGTLVEIGAEYRHYCADRICGLLDAGRTAVVEIGGGFGGMAYYLLRDRPEVTYIGFDVPESIALASWFLVKAFPDLRFLFYGEEELTTDSVARADVVLMPLSELPTMPGASADVTFSSHAISDVSPDEMGDYLGEIARITRERFLFMGNSRAGRLLSDLTSRGGHSLALVETGSSAWSGHRIPSVLETECVFRVRRA